MNTSSSGVGVGVVLLDPQLAGVQAVVAAQEVCWQERWRFLQALKQSLLVLAVLVGNQPRITAQTAAIASLQASRLQVAVLVLLMGRVDSPDCLEVVVAVVVASQITLVARHHHLVKAMQAAAVLARSSPITELAAAVEPVHQEATAPAKQAAMAVLARHHLSQAPPPPMQVAAAVAHIRAALRELAVPVGAAMAVSGLATTTAQTALPIQAVVAAVQEPTPAKLERHQPAATAALGLWWCGMPSRQCFPS